MSIFTDLFEELPTSLQHRLYFFSWFFVATPVSTDIWLISISILLIASALIVLKHLKVECGIQERLLNEFVVQGWAAV